MENILEDTFFSGRHYYRLKFFNGVLEWKNLMDSEGVVSLCLEKNVMAITEIKDENALKGKSSVSNGFTLHYVQKYRNMYKYEVMTFEKTDHAQVKVWLEHLENYIKGIKRRPKYILLFLNPNAGNRKALQIYHKKVKPLLDLCGITVNLVVTQGPKYAQNLLIQHGWPADVDGVIALGGDGTLCEIINGIVIRTANESGTNIDDEKICLPFPKVRIGIIPAGSTDTTVYSIHNSSDVETATIHIIFGYHVSVDVGAVHNDRKFLSCCISVLSYGFLGKVIESSEGLRCLGPMRYEISGFWNMLQSSSHAGRFSFIYESDTASANGIPTNSVKCCQSNGSTEIQGSYFMVSSANISCASTRAPNGLAPRSKIDDGCFHVVVVNRISIFEKIHFFQTLASRSRIINDLPFVRVYKVKRFIFEAEDSQYCCIARSREGLWNCDGELLRSHYISAKCHQELLKIFGRNDTVN